MAKAHLALSHAVVAHSKGTEIEKMQAVINCHGFQYYTHSAMLTIPLRSQWNCERNIIHTTEQLS